MKAEGKHQCPFCPKRYRFKHSLKDHINKHTGNRPHHCKYCSLCFMHLGSLCAHVKRRHAQFMLPEYQCRICNEMFMSEQFLKQHYTWKHKGEKVLPSATATNAMMMNAAGLANPYPNMTDVANKMLATPMDQSKDSSGSLVVWNNQTADVSKNPDWNTGPNSNGVTADGGHQNSSGAIVKTEPNFTPGSDEFLHTREGGIASGHGSSSSMHFNSPAVNVGFQQMAHTLSMFSGFPFARGCNPLSSFSPFTPSYQQNIVASVMSSTDGTAKLEDGSTLQRSADGKFQCPYCEKSYNFKHTLKDHINKHLGKRPHVCKHCGDTFVHLASLCAHIKRRHDEHMPTEFRCEICHEKLMNYQSLKQHYTWRHREARMFMEANEYSMFTNSIAGDASGAANKDGHQTASQNQMFFFPGQAMEGGEVQSGDSVTCQSKKPKSVDMLGVSQDFDAVENFDGLLPGDFHPVASTPKSAASGRPELGPVDHIDKCDQQPDIFAGPSMLAGNETGHQMPLVAEYFDEIDVQTPHGNFKYKCRLCGHMLKPQANLSEHLNSHYAGRKAFPEETGGAVGTDTNGTACLGCTSKFRSTVELQQHLEANPEHLPQSWHQQ